MSAEYVGDTVENPICSFGFADGREPVSTERVWRAPGSRCVDDGPGTNGLKSLRSQDTEVKWTVRAPGRRHLVDALAGDGDNFGVEADRSADFWEGRKWRKVAVHQFAASRIPILLGFVPTRLCQQLTSSRVD